MVLRLSKERVIVPLHRSRLGLGLTVRRGKVETPELRAHVVNLLPRGRADCKLVLERVLRDLGVGGVASHDR